MYYDLKADSLRERNSYQKEKEIDAATKQTAEWETLIMPYTIGRRSCIAWHTPSDTACHQERSL